MTLRRICAWCGRVLAEGDPGAPVTHGICGECEERVMGDDEKEEGEK